MEKALQRWTPEPASGSYNVRHRMLVGKELVAANACCSICLVRNEYYISGTEFAVRLCNSQANSKTFFAGCLRVVGMTWRAHEQGTHTHTHSYTARDRQSDIHGLTATDTGRWCIAMYANYATQLTIAVTHDCNVVFSLLTGRAMPLFNVQYNGRRGWGTFCLQSLPHSFSLLHSSLTPPLWLLFYKHDHTEYK